MDFLRRVVMVSGSDLLKRVCSDSATKGLVKALPSSHIVLYGTPLPYPGYCTVYAVLIGECKTRNVSPVWYGTHTSRRAL